MNDLLHREGGKPAIEHANGNKEYFEHGQPHRDDGLPAVECVDGYQEYFVRGKRHRDGDLPAIEHADGYTAYFINGERHRDGGKPAIDDGRGFQAWFVNGVEVSEPKAHSLPPPSPPPPPPSPSSDTQSCKQTPRRFGDKYERRRPSNVSYSHRKSTGDHRHNKWKSAFYKLNNEQRRVDSKWKTAFYKLKNQQRRWGTPALDIMIVRQHFADALRTGPEQWKDMNRTPRRHVSFRPMVFICMPY